jgi:hypothetical protein
MNAYWEVDVKYHELLGLLAHSREKRSLASWQSVYTHQRGCQLTDFREISYWGLL